MEVEKVIDIMTEAEKVELNQRLMEEYEEFKPLTDFITGATRKEKEKGSCTNCGRTLTDPRSIAAKYGPVCFQKLFGKPIPGTSGTRTRKREFTDEELQKMQDARKWFV